jgi:hypothetical protein
MGVILKKIELQNIRGGVVFDLFDEELRKVLSNIEDENTTPNTERAITLKIAIRPDKLRRTAEVKVQASCTLAKLKPAESLLFFDRNESGEFSAYVDDPGPDLPGINDDPAVKPFPRVGNGG